MKNILIFFFAGAVFFAFGLYTVPLMSLAQEKLRLTKTVAPEKRKGLFVEKGGFWHPRRSDTKNIPGSNFDQLLSLGYVTGSQKPAEELGVTVYDINKTSAGLNVYTSAHAPVAILMDMHGNILHQWMIERDKVWPHLKNIDLLLARRYFRRVHLCENGDLLVIFEYTGILRIDANSNLLWSHAGCNHHDLDIAKNGNIYVLGRYRHEEKSKLFQDIPKVEPVFIAGIEVFDENITVLDPDTGDVIDYISLIDCLKNSTYVYLLDIANHYKDRKTPLDLLHTNTISILDGKHAHRSPAFKEGNILVSFRNLSTIAIIDPLAKKVVWAMSYAWRQQHQPVLLSNGNMLLFDNIAGEIISAGMENRSRIVEFNPLTQEIYWEYMGNDESPFSSVLMGSNQRLPNGNTLITESDYGRVFEVTADKKIVWEFNNPHAAGQNDEYVAVIPELIRLEPDFPINNFIQTSTMAHGKR